MSQQKLLEHLLAILDKSNIDYMVTGSVVSSLQGEPRATHGVDIVVRIHVSSISSLISAFQPPRFFLSENSIKEAIQHQTMFNLLDTTEGDKVDFWILTNDPFDQSRFERKCSEEVFGMKMKVSSPEDTILAKLKWASYQEEVRNNLQMHYVFLKFSMTDLTLPIWKLGQTSLE